MPAPFGVEAKGLEPSASALRIQTGLCSDLGVRQKTQLVAIPVPPLTHRLPATWREIEQGQEPHCPPN
jgi:hypothetical protein